MTGRCLSRSPIFLRGGRRRTAKGRGEEVIWAPQVRFEFSAALRGPPPFSAFKFAGLGDSRMPRLLGSTDWTAAPVTAVPRELQRASCRFWSA